MSGVTSPEPESESTPETAGVDAFFDRYSDRHRYYGSGKAALRDALAPVVDRGRTVLLPAYVPDAVREPIRDLGLEAAFYAITADLAPDLDDLERRLSTDAVAVVTVDYFGFPQPAFDAVDALAAEYGCLHVEDAAHAAFSVVDGTLLGTRGDVGFASLRKTLPAPDGAVLFLPDDDLAGRLEPSSFAGVADSYGAADCRFVLGRLLSRLAAGRPAVRRAIDAVGSAAGTAPATIDPATRYEASKARMSKLSRRVVASVDPTATRSRRRDDYLAWDRALESVPHVDRLERRLAEGICPQAYPVVTERPDALLAALESESVAAHTWPRLPAAVREDDAYGTARWLSDHLITVPTDPRRDPADVDAIGRRLPAAVASVGSPR